MTASDQVPYADAEDWLRVAIAEAELGAREGGIPIGAALIYQGVPLATGRNQRMQRESAILHAEIDCLDKAGRRPAEVYSESILVTTLSPCFMCAGAIMLYKIPKVVVGEHRTFCQAEEWLRGNGVEVLVMDNEQCRRLMSSYIATKPKEWNEDIGIAYDPPALT